MSGRSAVTFRDRPRLPRHRPVGRRARPRTLFEMNTCRPRFLGPAWVLAGLFFFLGWADASSPPPPSGAVAQPTENFPRILIEKAQMDLGEVMESGTVSSEFVVRNVGTAPLTIEQVRPG